MLACEVEDIGVQPTLVSLMPGGIFASTMTASAEEEKNLAAPSGPSKDPFDGRWSVNPESLEVEVAIYGIGHSVRYWFIGKLAEDGALVEGYVGAGAMDPEWVGKFTLTKFMPGFESEALGGNTAAASKVPAAAPLQFTVEDLVGSWRVKTIPHKDQPRDQIERSDDPDDFDVAGRRKVSRKKAAAASVRSPDGRRIRRDNVVGETNEGVLIAPSFFEVALKPDLTWVSTSGFGEGNRIGGRWNVFEGEISVHSGIRGVGQKVWLECRRFNLLGGSSCVGVSLGDDTMYMGHINFSLGSATTPMQDQGAEGSSEPQNEDSDGIMKISLSVSGYIAVGYQNEVFLKYFNLFNN